MTQGDTQAPAYWGEAFAIEESDLDYLYNLLLEEETPLTTQEMALAIIERRVEREAQAAMRREQGTTLYRPAESFAVGQTVVFPALDYVAGSVVGVRPGRNPEYPDLQVIRVDFGEGRPTREFAAALPEHKLNEVREEQSLGDSQSPQALADQHGAEIAAKLDERLRANADLVRLADRWFPRALLATVNVGHLNLAEAVLDMAGGEPLPTEALLKEVGLPTNINPRLQAFSLNYALQEDERFDEVGPAGQVMWYLRRLEPPAVMEPAPRLQNTAPEYDRSILTPELLELEAELDDEFSPGPPATEPNEVQLALLFPHRRVGTLGISHRLAPLFPTAFESPRIRFTWVDGDSGERFPGWVVRAGQYVYGLDEWYRRLELPAGAILTVGPGEQAGEVVLRARRRRPTREWARTAAAGHDGRLALTMQKRLVGAEYDELMIVATEDFAATDEVARRSQSLPFARLVADVFRELAKLNPQSAVHARSLYAAVNVARRCPPGPIFAELASQPYYTHVGDAYWRFDQSRWTE